MKPLRIGVIGAGNRASSYFQGIPASVAPAVRLSAIADPSCQRRETFSRAIAPGEQVAYYDTGAELLEGESELDALIISSPNHVHADDAILAMQRGVPVLLEKPVAINLDQCARLWQTYRACNEPKVFVGFVLRYTSFYGHVQSILRENRLGQLLSVDMDENIQSNVTSLFFRGWRRWNEFSGGFMVEKCCHDFDILNWLTAARAVRVFSVARRTHFVPRPRLEQHRRFDHAVISKAVLDYESPIASARFAELSPDSIYELDGDAPDHQSVMIEFDNGVLSCFTACHAQPRNTRRTRICGADGSLEGDIEQSRLRIDEPDGDAFDYRTQHIDIKPQSGGHYGGDRQLKDAFWKAVAGEASLPQAAVREGIEAVLVALAAEMSSKSGMPVDVAAMREQVFGKPAAAEACASANGSNGRTKFTP